MKPFRPPSRLRALLVLGRLSNLPTVWSNCLAGWCLAGGGPWLQWALVAFCLSLIYAGGMFLNDAFDAGFDRQNRRARPIPSGAIAEADVWRWGFLLLALGAGGLAWKGVGTAIFVLFLTGCIILYNAIHKLAAASPVLLGACRWLVYLIAASVAGGGINGLVAWSGLALASYVMGLSWLARKEVSRGPAPGWPIILLAAPLLLAVFVNDLPARDVLVLGGICLVWTLYSLRHSFWRQPPNLPYTVSRLLAGITLVDLLAVADFAHPVLPALFLAFFLLALILQRYIPAT